MHDAFEHARDVDRNLVDAQQTRRVLDRIVGYQISPLLWDKVRRGLSAGRVQTVALRLIVEREREIKAFVPVEYWTLDAQLTPANEKTEFTARFIGIDGEKAVVETVDAPSLPNQQQMDAVVAALEKATWSVQNVEKKERRRNATAPFTTSKLQQDASRQLGFSVRRTMGVAQRLYEGIELGSEGAIGLITYMRTDSTRVSPDAIAEARQWIEQNTAKTICRLRPMPSRARRTRRMRTRRSVRPASSIIRTRSGSISATNSIVCTGSSGSALSPRRWCLPCSTRPRSISSPRQTGSYNFRVTGSVMKFDGFLKVYEEAKEKKDDEDEELKNRLPRSRTDRPWR